MVSDSATDLPDLDSRRTCLTCNIRMSSILHDKHTLCISCHGNECAFDNRCSECSAWTDDVMNKYIKYRKKKKSDKEKEDSFSRSSSVESNATPLGVSGSHSSGVGYQKLGF